MTTSHLQRLALLRLGAWCNWPLGTEHDVRSFAGVILVSLSDSGETPPVTRPSPTPTSGPALLAAIQSGEYSLLGDFLALLSALFYAVYVILLKVRIRSESRIDMQLFFGFVGLFNIIACWPIGVILHLTGVERFEPPVSGRVVAGLLVNVSFRRFCVVTSHKPFCRWQSHSLAIISMSLQCSRRHHWW